MNQALLGAVNKDHTLTSSFYGFGDPVGEQYASPSAQQLPLSGQKSPLFTSSAERPQYLGTAEQPPCDVDHLDYMSTVETGPAARVIDIPDCFQPPSPQNCQQVWPTEFPQARKEAIGSPTDSPRPGIANTDNQDGVIALSPLHKDINVFHEWGSKRSHSVHEYQIQNRTSPPSWQSHFHPPTLRRLSTQYQQPSSPVAIHSLEKQEHASPETDPALPHLIPSPCKAYMDQEPSQTVFGSGTPLHYAVSNGHLKTVRVLLASGADANALDEEGRAPIHLWAEDQARGPIAMAQLLVESGAQLERKNGRNMTALQVAAEMGNDEVVKILVSLGADVNARSGR